MSCFDDRWIRNNSSRFRFDPLIADPRGDQRAGSRPTMRMHRPRVAGRDLLRRPTWGGMPVMYDSSNSVIHDRFAIIRKRHDFEGELRGSLVCFQNTWLTRLLSVMKSSVRDIYCIDQCKCICHSETLDLWCPLFCVWNIYLTVIICLGWLKGEVAEAFL